MTRYETLLGAVRLTADRVRTIMPPRDVLGIDDVQRHFGVTYTEKQLIGLAANLPLPGDVLRAFAGTHVLVPGYPLSVNEIRALAADAFYRPDWYEHQPFANEKKVGVRWHLVRKEPVPGSCSKTFAQQTVLLTKDEEVPLACEVAYIATLYWLTHRERLLPNVYVRCQDKNSDGLRVIVGNVYEGGLCVNDDWNDICNSRLGLAAARKL